MQDLFGPPVPFDPARAVPYHPERKVRPCPATDLTVRVVNFDLQDQTLLWLSQLFDIVSELLVKMGAVYIARVIFSSYSESLCAFQNGTLIAGATYRLFDEFAELIFFCVDKGKHSHGVGRYLMNQLKNHLQALDISHILVFADETALGFFEGQGFSRTIGLDRSVWEGRISTYSNSVLLYFFVSDSIDYAHFEEWRSAVGDFLVKRWSKPIRIPLIPYPQESVLGIPVIANDPVPPVILMRAIFSKVKAWPNIRMFSHVLSREGFREYHAVIKHPMALDIIECKLERAEYGTVPEFLDDLFLIATNALKFNLANSKYYRAGDKFRSFLWEKIQQYEIDYTPKKLKRGQ